MRWLTIIALGAALAACAAPQPTPPSPNPPRPVVLQFGQTHTWPTGDQITVSNPRTTPDRHYLLIDVTYRNGTPGVEPIGGIDSVLLLSVYAGGPQLNRIAIADDTTPVTNVLPGRSVTYQQAFDLVGGDPGDAQVQASGSMGDPKRPVVFFEGTA